VWVQIHGVLPAAEGVPLKCYEKNIRVILRLLANLANYINYYYSIHVHNFNFNSISLKSELMPVGCYRYHAFKIISKKVIHPNTVSLSMS
jgi:hypothetical protein